ncbi:SGNH/GDSL hydrolase family protein [Paenibacillus qinlingensis]|uniref:Lysophospholipase L1-like esterase n=1 Tax=Paenibacillus qinlingensis TaxID=1837343 RepID=A0ABU1NSE1_9BACL|nr:SGNH/GDSL hydrolase family protein [Paenibacillus qinlingensis]MDR6550406.1 lysophospholipase L1-like esterase [Paenibacillus qinlingensis]
MNPESCRQTAEAFIFIQEENMSIRYRPLAKQGMVLRSHADEDHPDNILYAEGIDYVVDYDRGVIRRTTQSGIPDWSRHELYSQSEFDHTVFKNCSNREFTVYGDYVYESDPLADGFVAHDNSGNRARVEHWLSKLRTSEESSIVVFGDSISAGGEASEEKFMYFNRVHQFLNDHYPRSRIRLLNKSVGGETSKDGKNRLERDVIPLQPDLVIIGFGMNDQNKYGEGVGVSPADFECNLCQMIEAIKKLGNSDIVLVTPCLPNPKWWYASGWTGRYAEVIRRLGREYGVGVADVTAVWEQELAAGKSPESLLLNNINHPNDYGHWLYFQAFVPLLKA